jgi:hypothetical protein
MMNHKPFGRTEQLVGNHQRSNRVVAGASPCVANDMRVAFGQARELGRIKARVHAGQNRETPRRGKRQAGL